MWKFNKRRGFYSSKHVKRARFSPLYRKTDFQMIGPVDPFQAYSELPTERLEHFDDINFYHFLFLDSWNYGQLG